MRYQPNVVGTEILPIPYGVVDRLTLRQWIVVQAPEHRVEVVPADPCAFDVKARRLEDPKVRHVVENSAGRQVEKVLHPRRLVRLAGGRVNQGVQGGVAVPDPCRKRTASAKERRDGVQRIREARRPGQEREWEASGMQCRD